MNRFSQRTRVVIIPMSSGVLIPSLKERVGQVVCDFFSGGLLMGMWWIPANVWFAEKVLFLKRLAPQRPWTNVSLNTELSDLPPSVLQIDRMSSCGAAFSHFIQLDSLTRPGPCAHVRALTFQII